MHQEAPFYLIAHSVVFMPMRKEVTGYKMSPFGRHQFDAVDLQVAAPAPGGAALPASGGSA